MKLNFLFFIGLEVVYIILMLLDVRYLKVLA